MGDKMNPGRSRCWTTVGAFKPRRGIKSLTDGQFRQSGYKTALGRGCRHLVTGGGEGGRRGGGRREPDRLLPVKIKERTGFLLTPSSASPRQQLDCGAVLKLTVSPDLQFVGP